MIKHFDNPDHKDVAFSGLKTIGGIVYAPSEVYFLEMGYNQYISE
jgi:hypothetical protein